VPSPGIAPCPANQWRRWRQRAFVLGRRGRALQKASLGKRNRPPQSALPAPGGMYSSSCDIARASAQATSSHSLSGGPSFNPLLLGVLHPLPISVILVHRIGDVRERNGKAKTAFGPGDTAMQQASPREVSGCCTQLKIIMLYVERGWGSDDT